MLAKTSAIALLVAIALTPAAGKLAWRLGIVARPSPRGVHRVPTPLLGGVAVVAAWLAALGLGEIGIGRSGPVVAILIGAAAMAGVGLWDDLRSPPWWAKLVAQVAIAVGFIAVALPELPWPVQAARVAWIVTLTNAFNLIDNSDGLASGNAAVAAAGYGVLAGPVAPEVAAVALALAGAASGFFVHNFGRSLIFLGDAGSLPLGFALGGLGAVLASHDGAPTWPALALPVSYPLFDVAFVIVRRTCAGRSPVVGGTDHTVHALGAALASLRAAVVLLVAATAVLTTAAITVDGAGGD